MAKKGHKSDKNDHKQPLNIKKCLAIFKKSIKYQRFGEEYSKNP